MFRSSRAASRTRYGDTQPRRKRAGPKRAKELAKAPLRRPQDMVARSTGPLSSGMQSARMPAARMMPKSQSGDPFRSASTPPAA